MAFFKAPTASSCRCPASHHRVARVEGSLIGVTATHQIVPGCDGELRRSQVATAIFADGVIINADGTRTMSGLGASLLVTGDASGSCGPGDVFFSVDLIRTI